MAQPPDPAPAPATAPAPTRKRSDLAWVASTNFGEGLPWSFIHQMATDFLTTIKAPIEQVGYTSWLHLAVTAKFLWSPVVDLAGTKRNWMVALQIVLGVGMLGVAAVSSGGLEGLWLFWLALGVLAIIHATHDIACDGYYLLALNRKDQALYAGPRVAAFRTAMLVGSSGLIYLAGRSSWPIAFAAAGVLMMLVGATNAIFVPRVAEPGRTRTPGKPGERRPTGDFFKAYTTFLQQPRIGLVLLFIMTLKLGDIMMFAMARPLLRDIGIGTEQRGIIATPQLISQIMGAMIAGGIIARWSLERTLVPIIYFMNLAIPLYAVLAWTAPSFPWVMVIVLVEQFAGGMGATAQSVYLMQRCRPAFSASHYAFATAITAIGTTVSGAFSGHLNAALGHKWYFIACFGFGIPSMILVLLVPKKPLEAEVGAPAKPA